MREMIRIAFEAEFGGRWRQRIPGALLAKIRKDESDEEKRKQFDFRRLGPLYYLTFGELTSLLRQKT